MTTRLVVKGLPSNCTEAKLRSFFEKYGTINDCTLKYTKDGIFRKFAFVGFDSVEDAKKALQETNLSYMGSSRLQVEECKPFGDANKSRAWSQYSKESSAYQRKHDIGSSSSQEDEKQLPLSGSSEKKRKLNPEYRDFLETQGLKYKETISNTNTTIDNDELVKELLEGITGDTRLSLIFTGLPPSIKQKNLKEWLSPVRVKALKIVRSQSFAAAFVTFNRPPDVRRALQRNQEYIGGYKLTISKPKTDDEISDTTVHNENATASRETEEAKIRDDLLQTGRLFVRNLPFTAKEEDLYFLFRKYGEISDIQVIIDKKSNKCKGFAIIEYVFPESAVAAYSSNDGTIFKGRMMHIIPGLEKRENAYEAKSGEPEKTSFKKEKIAKLKANAGKAHSWNSLFLGPNAVADTLAERLGIKKSDLINSEVGESAGVRLALAETRLVRETREFFLANNVCLDSFSRPAAKRSNMVIIAKNLPANVQAEELRRMFAKFGEVDKVLMPPEGGISAIIAMSNAVDAKKAFQALAYSRFRTQPLYLEWAPGDVFSKPVENKPDATCEISVQNMEAETSEKKKNKREMTYEERKAEKVKRVKRNVDVDVENTNETEMTSLNSAQPSFRESVNVDDMNGTNPQPTLEENANTVDSDIIEPCSAVFVKNLSFNTTEEGLAKLFRTKYRIKSTQISKKLNLADPGKSLSMGFGFVQFFTQDEAQRAIKEMQGELLDGHCLELKISHRELNDNDAMKRKPAATMEQGNCTKLLVRNIPFQASVKEIESLFSSFGEVKSIRIPKKIGSRDQHRGFGFVDFISIGEAKRAFEALVHSTHIYGRRLVLEWAKNDDSVKEMREKTAEKFSGNRAALRKQKNRMDAIEKDLALIDDD